MNKIFILGAIVLVIVVGGYFYLNTQGNETVPEVELVATYPTNATYIIDGESFTLVNGLVEKEITPDSATKNKVSIFGEPAFGDIDSDGDQDAVLLLVNEPGGSGTFYYAALAVNNGGVFRGTDSILLGDRIAPQDFYIEDNRAVVNYATRNFGEDFSVAPSMAESLYIQFDPETFQLIQIASDFEGEANPDVMSLDMQTWTWFKTTYTNGTEVTPNKVKAFTLTFKEPGSVTVATDCNAMSGAYELVENKITFGPMTSTKMFCQDSQEQDFATMLAETQQFYFTSKGELVFDLKADGGSVVFH